MGIRLAIGTGKCADYSDNGDPIVRELCSHLRSRVSYLRSLSVERLLSIPRQATEIEPIGSTRAAISTYRDPTEAGTELVVVQGFLPSWRHARYFGSVGVGLMLAEGLLLLEEGVIDAPDSVMWGYR